MKSIVKCERSPVLHHATCFQIGLNLLFLTNSELEIFHFHELAIFRYRKIQDKFKNINPLVKHFMHFRANCFEIQMNIEL